MYARITHVKMTDVKAAVERINENKHLMTEMTGWISSRIVQVSEDEAMGIGFFPNQRRLRSIRRTVW